MEGCDVTSLKSVLVTHTKRTKQQEELCRRLNFRIRELWILNYLIFTIHSVRYQGLPLDSK